MRHCERETEFLKEMLVNDDNTEYRVLETQLTQTQKALRCVRRAARRVVLLMLLCVAAVGYSVVFLPDFTEGRPHYLINIFTTVILACLICLTTYCAIWLWQSHTAAKIHMRCRKALLGREQSRSDADAFNRIRQLQDLQDLQESGSSRFDRSGRGLQPTPEAESNFKAP